MGDFLGDPMVNTQSNAGPWVRSLVKELRYHMPHGTAKNKQIPQMLIWKKGSKLTLGPNFHKVLNLKPKFDF